MQVSCCQQKGNLHVLFSEDKWNYMLYWVHLLTPTIEASGGYTKSLHVLDQHFWPQNEHSIIKLIHFPDSSDQKWGVQNDRLDKVYKMEQDNKYIFSFLCPDFCKTFWSIFRIFQFWPFLTTIYYP